MISIDPGRDDFTIPTYAGVSWRQGTSPFDEAVPVVGTPFFFVEPRQRWMMYGDFTLVMRSSASSLRSDTFYTYPQRFVHETR